MAFVYHGTPLTPKAAFEAIMPGKGVCVSFGTPSDDERAALYCPNRMYDNGEFKEWNRARKKGQEWDDKERNYSSLFAWYESRIFNDGCWGVIPDRPGAPSQINDALLNIWPFGRERGAPLYHMNTPIYRLGKLCDRFDLVCLGWVGDFDPAINDIKPEQKAVGCEAYLRKMDEVSVLFGNSWPRTHMMRGIAVGSLFPWESVDATSLAQNGHLHDWRDHQPCLLGGYGLGKWNGRRWYRDHLEALAA